MADSRHLEILEQGVETWNTWRRLHPEVHPDLQSIVFMDGKLTDTNMEQKIENISDAPAELTYTHLDLSDFNFSHTDLRHADLTRCFLNGTNFRAANLSGANLVGAALNHADLQNADLQEAILSNASLTHANLSHTCLDKAILSGTDLFEADLSHASCQGTTFRGANFTAAHLTDADLNQAILCGTIFHYTHVQKTNIVHAVMGWTIINAVDLSDILGLETIIHLGPSEVSLHTLSRSGGKLPISFLTGTGISGVWSEQLRMHNYPSRIAQNKTHFICYCLADQPFAQQLATDLQNHSICCWLAPTDTEQVDTFWNIADDNTLFYDRLIPILSHHSDTISIMNSLLLEALKREQHTHKQILYPVRLDETVLDTGLARTKHIIDFTSWKMSIPYQHALQQLITELHSAPYK